MPLQYEPRTLDRIAERLGTSTAALEQYLQLKQREVGAPERRVLKGEGEGGVGKGEWGERYLG